MPKKNETPALSFEQAMDELEKLVDSMENGELSLDDSLKAFEEGVRLTRLCQQSLREAEQKVMILTEKTADAELEPFAGDE
jgi:exodeoxyribonuclease VII small subunit